MEAKLTWWYSIDFALSAAASWLLINVLEKPTDAAFLHTSYSFCFFIFSCVPQSSLRTYYRDICSDLCFNVLVHSIPRFAAEHSLPQRARRVCGCIVGGPIKVRCTSSPVTSSASGEHIDLPRFRCALRNKLVLDSSCACCGALHLPARCSDSLSYAPVIPHVL